MAAISGSKPSSYRWVIEVMLFLILMAQAVAWLNPAPILSHIAGSLHLGLGEAGLVVSIVAVCMCVFSLGSGWLSEKFGARNTAVIGVWAMAAGLILAGFAHSFGSLLGCRILQGIGYGLVMAPLATFMMGWFPVGEWAYINMANSSAPFIGFALIFAFYPVVFELTGKSWNLTFEYTGILLGIVAILWTVLGREHESGHAEAGGAHGAVGKSTLSEVIRRRDVQLIAVALWGSVWTFEIYTTFLPIYLHNARGFSLAEGAQLVAILPLTAAFAGIGAGLATALVGLRKPFLWPLQFLMYLGALGAAFLPSPTLVLISMILFGIGTSGPLSATYTTMMELPGMTPVKMGSAFGAVWGVTFAGAFISPFLGGAIADKIGLLPVMIIFACSVLAATFALYLLPETGPRAHKAEPPVIKSAKDSAAG
ncbi:MAG: MFS transporter [Candidatus Binataceae bacterium]